MKRWGLLSCWVVGVIAGAHACGGTAVTNNNSGNANWLTRCEVKADCGEGLSCLCNTCQQLCADSSDCTLAAPGSRCARSTDALQCNNAPAGIRLCVKNCDVSSDCERNDLICIENTCVSRNASTIPDAAMPDAAMDAAPDAQLPLPHELDAAPREDAASDLRDGATGSLDTGVPPNDAAPTAGKAFSVAYAFPDVWNVRADCSATFNSDGNMTAFNFSPSEYFTMGNATFQSAHSDGIVAWGEWIGGPIEGAYGGHDFSRTFMGLTDGFHYAVGAGVPTHLPGESIYQLIGLTMPSKSDGSAMSLDDLAIAINFDSSRVGAEATATTNRGTEAFATSGGVTDPVASHGMLGTDYLFEFMLQNAASFVELHGAVVGDQATDLVVSYRVEISNDAGLPGPGLEFYGTAVLRRPLVP